MKALHSPHGLQTHAELDLAILNMDTHDMEHRARAVLQKLPGIHNARLVERGAWIDYNPLGITKEEISKALEQSGLRVGIFQDSKSGRTGHSSA